MPPFPEVGGRLAPVIAGLEIWIVSVELVLDCVEEACDFVNRNGLLFPQAIDCALVFLAQIADAVAGVFQARCVRSVRLD
jgi:hypothetical protein